MAASDHLTLSSGIQEYRRRLIDTEAADNGRPPIGEDPRHEREESSEAAMLREMRVGDRRRERRVADEILAQLDLLAVAVLHRPLRNHRVLVRREVELARDRQARADASDRHAARARRVDGVTHGGRVPDPQVVGLVPAGEEDPVRRRDAVHDERVRGCDPFRDLQGLHRVHRVDVEHVRVVLLGARGADDDDVAVSGPLEEPRPCLTEVLRATLQHRAGVHGDVDVVGVAAKPRSVAVAADRDRCR